MSSASGWNQSYTIAANTTIVTNTITTFWLPLRGVPGFTKMLMDLVCLCGMTVVTGR